MGFNTSLMICNDGIDQLERHPDEFVAGLVQHYHRGGTFGVGNHGNMVQVHAADHADATQLIAVGGNYSTKLYTQWTGGVHHTREAQTALLKQWAKELGFRLVKV